MSIGNGEIMSPRFHDEILLGVKVRESGGYFCIARLETIDLLENSDCFQSKILFAVMLREATKAGDRPGPITNPRMKIAQRVNRGEIVRLVGDDQGIFFYRCRNLSKFKILLSRAQSLYLVEYHVMNSK